MTSSGERVENCMQRDLVTVKDGTNLVVVAKTMTEQKIGCVLIHREGGSSQNFKMIGLLSEADLVRKGLAQGLSLSDTMVTQIMAPTLLTIPIQSTMLEASHVMEQSRVRHLCVADVADEDEIVGLISIRDLVKHFVHATSGPIRDLDDVYRPLSVLMQTAMEKIDREETLSMASTLMANKHIGSLLVMQGGKVVGIVTERDLVQKGIALDHDPNHVTVGTVMRSPLIDIDINRTVHDASDLMAEQGIRHLPVTENHAIVGILSVRDLIRMISVRDRPRFLRDKREHD
ncbi:cyclic nucleotide-binding/CBS domain-containing protein [Candidatus Nitronereus thalassa]|uniref:CBS domain-containing protein n=1 Tax=Candidatus Nitronereus thalassa TaxID=3020898 RepID=A0ABU3K315_9BACT|nr:CBS domain-containing protein [Candidatus Nitronereus thalassa]MDT7040775.1 CBS domain-containing protein [Candidatus Nitronereus thalassa]